MKKYSILFSELSKKTPYYEPDVYHFESIHEFLAFTKKIKFNEKMSINYRYILSDPTDEKTNKYYCVTSYIENEEITHKFRITEEAKHYKKFKKLLKKYMS